MTTTKDRLLRAALDYIDLSPCDPDITVKQRAAWQRLQEARAEYFAPSAAGRGDQRTALEGAEIMAKNEELETRFTYHAPKPGQPEKYEALRATAKELAYLIEKLTPPSREQALALTKLEEAVMWAHAAIARRGS